MIRGIVLAAGEGSRIGRPKALLRTSVPHESFLERACRVLLDGGVDEVVAVVAPALSDRLALPSLPGVRVEVNPEPAAGQLSSLQRGLGGLEVDPSTAAVVLPVDVALVAVDTVRAVIERWRTHRPRVVRPTGHARHGHPVLFDSSLLPELMRIDLADGARTIVRAHCTPAGELPIDDEGAYLDVDTVEDYLRVFGRLPEGVSVR